MGQAASPKGEIRIEPVQGEAELVQALAIREVVFIEEQHVPEDIEKDELDRRAFHVLAFDGGHAVATGRLVELDRPPDGEAGRWGQIGRMAVLQAYRKMGLGKRVLDALEAEAHRRSLAGILLHAQVHARDFYVRAGYEGLGPIFEEAGMPHTEMRKRLGPPPRTTSSSKLPRGAAPRGRSHRPAAPGRGRGRPRVAR